MICDWPMHIQLSPVLIDTPVDLTLLRTKADTGVRLMLLSHLGVILKNVSMLRADL